MISARRTRVSSAVPYKTRISSPDAVRDPMPCRGRSKPLPYKSTATPIVGDDADTRVRHPETFPPNATQTRSKSNALPREEQAPPLQLMFQHSPTAPLLGQHLRSSSQPISVRKFAPLLGRALHGCCMPIMLRFLGEPCMGAVCQSQALPVLGQHLNSSLNNTEVL